MKPAIFYFNIILIAVCDISLFNSCTIIGFGVGSIVDHSHKKNARIIVQQIKKLHLEQTIVVCTNDSTKTKGAYKGIVDMTEEEYLKKYDAFLNNYSNDSLIPKIGDTLMIFDTSDKTSVYGTMVAFEAGSIRLLKINNNKPFKAELDKNMVVYY